MVRLLILGLSPLLFVLLLTPALTNWLVRRGIVDHPDNRRKLHPRAVPRLGGTLVASGYVLAFALLFLLGPADRTWVDQSVHSALKYIPGAIAIFVTGLLDDLFGLRPWEKLMGQLAGAGMACWSGVTVTQLAGVPIPEPLGVAITVIWMLACINAFNLIDGMDGLAAGAGLFATVTMIAAAEVMHDASLLIALLPLAAALLGFLRYNFSPASIYLGDCGSFLIGFVLACCGVSWMNRSGSILAASAPLIALTIPLLDMSLAITRRILRNQSIFAPDRRHMHHRLLDLGHGQRSAVTILYIGCAVFSAISLLTAWESAAGVVVVLFSACTWMGVKQLRYVEFLVLGRAIQDRTILRVLAERISLRAFAASLEETPGPQECWDVLQRTYAEFGFSRVEADFAGQKFAAGGPIQRDACRVEVPLREAGSVLLWRAPAQVRGDSSATAFVSTLQSVLTHKLSEFGEYPRSRVSGGSVLRLSRQKR